MYSFQKHRCRRTQLAQWNWPVTTGCPHTDQSQALPFQREPVCGSEKTLSNETFKNPRRIRKTGPYAERRFSLVSFSAKMWTVPLSLEAHRKEESWLKFILERINKRGMTLSRQKSTFKGFKCYFFYSFDQHVLLWYYYLNKPGGSSVCWELDWKVEGFLFKLHGRCSGSGGSARIPPENCRSTLEQGTEPTNAHIGPCNKLATQDKRII